MQELKPFATVGSLKKALDNGGRFYNFFDAADDEVVSRGELAKAAGVYTAGIQAFLYLQMTSQDIAERDRESVLSMLDVKLRKEFARKKPPFVQPSEVDSGHKAGEPIIVTGFARETGKQSQLVGFITVPIMVGKVFIPMMIPVHDIYRVIEFYDTEKMIAPCAIVCVQQAKKIDLTGRIQVGGVLKKLESKPNEPATHPVFLDTVFWMKRQV